MHSMEDDLAIVFGSRAEAVAAVDDLADHGLADDQLVRAAHGASPVICDVDTDRAVLGAVVRGVVIGVAGGIVVGALLLSVGLLVAGAEFRLLPILLGGGFGGFAAGVFFGFVGGAVATQRLLYEEERWGDVPLAEGEVLVVTTPAGPRQEIREILQSHGGRPVDAPPHSQLAA